MVHSLARSSDSLTWAGYYILNSLKRKFCLDFWIPACVHDSSWEVPLSKEALQEGWFKIQNVAQVFPGKSVYDF